jgi:hypothetical protein
MHHTMRNMHSGRIVGCTLPTADCARGIVLPVVTRSARAARPPAAWNSAAAAARASIAALLMAASAGQRQRWWLHQAPQHVLCHALLPSLSPVVTCEITVHSSWFHSVVRTCKHFRAESQRNSHPRHTAGLTAPPERPARCGGPAQRPAAPLLPAHRPQPCNTVQQQRRMPCSMTMLHCAVQNQRC